jgi:hypothetical protein
MKLLSKFSGIILLTVFSCQSQRTMDTQDKIIFKDSSSHILQDANLLSVTGQDNYEMPDKKNISPEAAALHQEARALGQAGKYDLSISQTAAGHDPGTGQGL